jgi:hypothetical protein
VPSREAAKFVVEVYDWDRVGTSCFPCSLFLHFLLFPFLSPSLLLPLALGPPLKGLLITLPRTGTPDKLGFGTIDLASLEPFESVEKTISLKDFKTGASAGQIRVRLMFQVAFLRCVLLLPLLSPSIETVLSILLRKQESARSDDDLHQPPRSRSDDCRYRCDWSWRRSLGWRRTSSWGCGEGRLPRSLHGRQGSR